MAKAKNIFTRKREKYISLGVTSMKLSDWEKLQADRASKEENTGEENTGEENTEEENTGEENTGEEN